MTKVHRPIFFFLLFVYLFFKDRVCLCNNPVCLGFLFVDQGGLQLTEIHVSQHKLQIKFANKIDLKFPVTPISATEKITSTTALSCKMYDGL